MGAQLELADATPSATPDVRGVRGPAGEFGARGVIDLDSDARDVYAFLARVEDQPSWNLGVKRSEVLERAGPTKRVAQVVSWNFLALHGDFHLRLRCTEDAAALRIATELEEGGTMMRRFHSTVAVDATGPRRCRLEMSMFMQPRIFVPPVIRGLVTSQVRRQLGSVLSRLKASVEGGADAEVRARRRAAREMICAHAIVV